MPQGITYNPCPEGCRGAGILKYIISGLFIYVEQNDYLKILIGCVWGSGGRGKGVSGPLITFHLKRALALSIFDRLSPF